MMHQKAMMMRQRTTRKINKQLQEQIISGLQAFLLPNFKT